MLADATVFEEQKTARRTIELEFLFLDLTTCTRCVGTDENLNIALDQVQHVLASTHVDVQVKKILIENEEQAKAHNFITSPTIRVNGRDIALEMKESRCDSCTDLCGCSEGTDCRVWLYGGQEYTEAPVGMIVEAVLREAFAAPQESVGVDQAAGDVPENLKQFFAGASANAEPTSATSACCSAEKQETCCEPSAKASCCGTTSTTGSCGCQ